MTSVNPEFLIIGTADPTRLQEKFDTVDARQGIFNNVQVTSLTNPVVQLTATDTAGNLTSGGPTPSWATYNVAITNQLNVTVTSSRLAHYTVNGNVTTVSFTADNFVLDVVGVATPWSIDVSLPSAIPTAAGNLPVFGIAIALGLPLGGTLITGGVDSIVNANTVRFSGNYATNAGLGYIFTLTFSYTQA